MSDSDIGKTLPFAQRPRDVGDAGRLDRVEDGGQELRRRASGGTGCRSSTATLLLAGEQLGECRPVDRLASACARRLGRVRRPAPARPGRSRRSGSRSGSRARACRGALRLVVGRADRERIHRLVRDLKTLRVGHGLLRTSSARELDASKCRAERRGACSRRPLSPSPCTGRGRRARPSRRRAGGACA